MDWIDEVENEKKYGPVNGPDGERRVRLFTAVNKGIEEVRALRKENEDLEQAKQSWIKRAEEETARAERLEKEKRRAEEMKEAAETAMYAHAHEANEWREKYHAVEKERAELGNKVAAWRHEAQRWKSAAEPPETQKDLRDEFAQEFMVRAGNSAMFAYKRADELLEARKK